MEGGKGNGGKGKVGEWRMVVGMKMEEEEMEEMRDGNKGGGMERDQVETKVEE